MGWGSCLNGRHVVTADRTNVDYATPYMGGGGGGAFAFRSLRIQKLILIA